MEALDILVNNAGISLDTASAPDGTDVDTFRRTYETNVFGVAAVTNAFLPLLRRSARPRIVNVSSGTSSPAWSTGPNPQFRSGSGAGAEAAAGAVRLALLPDDGPTGGFFSWDGTEMPW